MGGRNAIKINAAPVAPEPSELSAAPTRLEVAKTSVVAPKTAQRQPSKPVGPKSSRAKSHAEAQVGKGDSWLIGDSEVVEMIRAFDWSSTELGSLQNWPWRLSATVSVTLTSAFPINVIWGDGAVQVWNDAYAKLCGAKHPGMFGSDYRECWATAWPAIGPAFDEARDGRTVFLENQPMLLDRHGYLEETWFTMSLSPIRDGHGEILGLLLPVTETSAQVLSARRMRVLRDLPTRVSTATTVGDAISGTTQVLGENPLDVPLALLYMCDDESGQACLRGHTEVDRATTIAQPALQLDGDSFVARVLRDQTPVLIKDLQARCGPVHAGSDGEPLQRLMAFPITTPGADRAIGALVLGVSNRLPFDETYRNFLDLVAQSIVGSVVVALAREQEKARTDGLVELADAKNEFFANVSHEFRTPLTLMLGPLESELAEPDLQAGTRERLSMVHRNGLRLMDLVNSLLSFSRGEATPAEPSVRPTDLTLFTTELASLFRDTVESAGLALTVACDTLPEPVFIDRAMWEKIVLNLLSNAFKYTFEGEIAVELRWRKEHAELVVRDTGIGIPADQLPYLFDRFHRVKNTRTRSIEGTGIGLALVHEFVTRHGGQVTVDSDEGRGTMFVVTVPKGSARLAGEPPDQACGEANASDLAFAQIAEATRWGLTDNVPPSDDERGNADAWVGPGGRPRVLLADDNADMLRHVTGILESTFEVVAVTDGALALEAALANRPDLVITDVMMPQLDGFALLAAMRSDERTRTIPVIMLSARAGEAASIDGIDAGVDDYIVKPFSPRELVARVSRSLALAKLRSECEQQLAKTNNELVQTVARLASDVRTDPLTGLSNRRAWDEGLVRALAGAARTGSPLCLALLDLDGLKAYNDAHGHQAGDALLKDAGAAWKLALRATDDVARIGGDEFAVLMPDCTIEQAARVIARVRAATPYDQACSAGIVCWDGAETLAALIGRADAALYGAKGTASTRSVDHATR